MGQLTISRDGHEEVTVVDDGWVRFGVGNFATETFSAEATIVGNSSKPVAASVDATLHGDPLKPITAHVSSPSGQAIAAQLGATINGGSPLTAIIDGGTTPVSAAVTANVATPVKLDVGLGDVSLRDTTVKFKLFGLLTVLTIEVGP